jgi:caffeoyl-CoA O-methyltransferase
VSRGVPIFFRRQQNICLRTDSCVILVLGKSSIRIRERGVSIHALFPLPLIFKRKSSYIPSVEKSKTSGLMDILNRKIQVYLEGLTPDRDPILTEMETLAKEKNFPIIGPLVGRLLSLLASGTRAERILELGSGFGYSAYWFAKAIAKSGKVICTERDPRNRDLALNFLSRGGLIEKIDFKMGDSLSIIDELEGEFDLILNDIDKESYPKAFHKAVPRLRKGGILIADNVLWSGRVVEKEQDAATRAIREFNELTHTSPQLLTTVIPIRDGVSLSLKIRD